MKLNGRKVLRSFTHMLGNGAYKRKYKKNPGRFFTLRQICDKVGIDYTYFDEMVASKLDTTVSYICRWGDRFTKNCICVQLYDDSDDFMRLAFEHGALVCVTDHKIENVPCIVVDKPEVTYADMCSVIRSLSKTKSTVVVGSIGKTTTKKMVDAVYSKAFYTMCDWGNDNILDSVGSICQHFPQKAQQYIAEMSEDTPGLIEQMCKIANPQIAIITSIDKSHIEFYGSPEKIFEEFQSVTKHMEDDGVCITSLDEPNAKQLIPDKKVVYVSVENKEADFFASDISIDEVGIRFLVHEKATGEVYPVRLINTFAKHNVTSALFAFAAGVLSGVSYEKIVEGLLSYRATGIRQNVYKSGKTVIYADCYNAVAKSIRSAVLAAQNIPISGKRIAVLGDIAETGDYSKSTHAEIVEIVNQSEFDVFMTCGRALKAAAHEVGVRQGIVCLTFENQREMNSALKKVINSGDLVLFKASHSGHLYTSISATFPWAYFCQMVKYYIPRVLWHFKVILN